MHNTLDEIMGGYRDLEKIVYFAVFGEDRYAIQK